MKAELPIFIRVRRMLVDTMLGRKHEGLMIYSNVVLSDYQSLKLGNNVSLNRGCHLSCLGGLEIGDFVAIGHGTSIMTTEHGYTDPDLPIWSQPVISRPVGISPNVWIGAQVCILAGVELSSGTIVAAGAVVTKSTTESDTIIGGVPARFIKNRFS